MPSFLCSSFFFHDYYNWPLAENGYSKIWKQVEALRSLPNVPVSVCRSHKCMPKTRSAQQNRMTQRPATGANRDRRFVFAWIEGTICISKTSGYWTKEDGISSQIQIESKTSTLRRANQFTAIRENGKSNPLVGIAQFRSCVQVLDVRYSRTHNNNRLQVQHSTHTKHNLGTANFMHQFPNTHVPHQTRPTILFMHSCFGALNTLCLRVYNDFVRGRRRRLCKCVRV